MKLSAREMIKNGRTILTYRDVSLSPSAQILTVGLQSLNWQKSNGHLDSDVKVEFTNLKYIDRLLWFPYSLAKQNVNGGLFAILKSDNV